MTTKVFEGNRDAATRFLRDNVGRYYVYLLCRPDGTPFYVGKGLKLRALEHEAEARRHHPIGETNPFKCNVIRKIIRDGGQVLYHIESFFDEDEQQACLEREAALIAEHRRLHEGGILTNLAGGIGSMSGAAPYSLERHAATLSGKPENNPERAVLNTFLQGIGEVGSVPIKPVSQLGRILLTTPHPNARKPTKRNAYALIASASASGFQLKAGVVLPRSFRYQGVHAVIENGVSRDIMKSGIADLVKSTNPLDEAFSIDQIQIGIIASLVGRDHLTERGLL